MEYQVLHQRLDVCWTFHRHFSQCLIQSFACCHYKIIALLSVKLPNRIEYLNSSMKAQSRVVHAQYALQQLQYYFESHVQGPLNLVCRFVFLSIVGSRSYSTCTCCPEHAVVNINQLNAIIHHQ